MHITVDPCKSWAEQYPGIVPWERSGGGYLMIDPLTIALHTRRFDHLPAQHLTMIDGGKLRIDAGYWWDGSTMAINLSSSALASAIHDALCDALNDAIYGGQINLWEWLQLRRHAHQLYAAVCRAQGLWTLWAAARYIGLRIGGPVYSMACWAKRKMTGG